MRVLPLFLIASLTGPVGALAQNRVPPKADQVNEAPREDRTPPPQAVQRESPPPQRSEPAPAPQRSTPPPPPPPREQPQSVQRPVAPTAAVPVQDNGAAQAQRRQRVPPEARRDEGRQPSGTAVARPQGSYPPRTGDGNRDHDRHTDGRPVYVTPLYNSYYYPRQYYPYGYGAYGLGYFYYDPYLWNAPYGGPAYGYGGGYGGGYVTGGYVTGELRLDMKPRDAQVFVDGYYAGRVDDFDGVFQSLTLEEGGHHIQVVAPGYEPLDFDVRVSPDHKTTYRGDLLRRR